MRLIQQLQTDFIVEESLAVARLKFASDAALANPGTPARVQVREAAFALLDLLDTWRRRGRGQLWHRWRHTGPDGGLIFAALTFARLERLVLATAPEARRWDVIGEMLTAGKIIGAVEPDCGPAAVQ